MLTASVTPSLKERCRRCWKYCITHPERMFALGLRIKNKEGEIVRFNLNQAQTKVIEAIHRQLETTGKIRLVIIKKVSLLSVENIDFIILQLHRS